MWTPLFLSEVSFIMTIAIFQLWLLFFPQYSSLSKRVSFSMKWLQVNNLFSKQRGSQHANVKPLKLISTRVESKLFGYWQLYITFCKRLFQPSVWYNGTEKLWYRSTPINTILVSYVTQSQHLAWALHKLYMDFFYKQKGRWCLFGFFWYNASVAEKPIYQKIHLLNLWIIIYHFGREPQWYQPRFTEQCFEVSFKTKGYYRNKEYSNFYLDRKKIHYTELKKTL